MSKKIWKGGALLAPIPAVMVSCGSFEKSDIVTVAWCGMLATDPPTTYISLRPSRYSHSLITESKEFVINLTTKDLVRFADICGVFTGAKVDKFKKCGLTKEASQNVGCPSIAESPLSIECRVKDVVKLGSHDMFIADVLSVDVDERLIGEDGKLSLAKANLAAFAHGEYFSLGQKIGSFGFSVRKKHKNAKNTRKKSKNEQNA